MENRIRSCESLATPDRDHFILKSENFDLELIGAVWLQPEDTCREPREITNLNEVVLRPPLSIDIQVTPHRPDVGGCEFFGERCNQANCVKVAVDLKLG